MRKLILLSAFAVFATPTFAATSAQVTTNLKLRASPGAGGAVILTMPADATVSVDLCSDGWCRVRYDGKEGFASQQYLAISLEWTDEEIAALLSRASDCRPDSLRGFPRITLARPAENAEAIRGPDEETYGDVIGTERDHALERLIDIPYVLGQIDDEACRYSYTLALYEMAAGLRATARTISDSYVIARLEAATQRMLAGIGWSEMAKRQAEIALEAIGQATARILRKIDAPTLDDIDLDDVAKREGLLYGDRALVRLQQGDREAATADFEVSLKRHPDNPDLRKTYLELARPLTVAPLPTVALDRWAKRKAAIPTALAVSSDGSTLIVGYHGIGGGGTVRLWEWRKGVLTKTFDLNEVGSVQESSPDEIETTNDGKMVVLKWIRGGDLFGKHELISFGLDGSRNWERSDIDREFAVAENGEWAFVADYKVVRVIDLGTGETVRQFGPYQDNIFRDEELSVYGISAPINGRFFATKGNIKDVLMFDGETGKRFRAIPSEDFQVTGLAVSPRGDLVATYSETRFFVDLHDAETGRRTFRLDGHNAAPWGIRFSSDGRLLASFGADGTVIIWDTVSGTIRRRLIGHLSEIREGRFFADDKLFASVARDGSIRIWSVEDGTEIVALYALHDPEYREEYLAVLPDGSFAGTTKAIAGAISYDSDGKKQPLPPERAASLSLGATLGDRLTDLGN